MPFCLPIKGEQILLQILVITQMSLIRSRSRWYFTYAWCNDSVTKANELDGSFESAKGTAA